VVRRREAQQVLDRSRARVAAEDAARERYRAGELSLDVQAMRDRLRRKGLTYRDLDRGDRS
jgi:4-hydroxy-4-methyl-2-oxoglutarate aldolase